MRNARQKNGPELDPIPCPMMNGNYAMRGTESCSVSKWDGTPLRADHWSTGNEKNKIHFIFFL